MASKYIAALRAYESEPLRQLTRGKCAPDRRRQPLKPGALEHFDQGVAGGFKTAPP